jgi:hypothetical protein
MTSTQSPVISSNNPASTVKLTNEASGGMLSVEIALTSFFFFLLEESVNQ